MQQSTEMASRKNADTPSSPTTTTTATTTNKTDTYNPLIVPNKNEKETTSIPTPIRGRRRSQTPSGTPTDVLGLRRRTEVKEDEEANLKPPGRVNNNNNNNNKARNKGASASSSSSKKSKKTQSKWENINTTTLKKARDLALQETTTLDKLRAAETATFSLTTYFLGMFRVVYVYAFFQALLFGFAISVSIVLNSSFVTTRAQYWTDTIGESVFWIFITPLIVIVMSWLLDEALDVMMDTLKHSPWVNLDPLVVNERQKFVYLSTGGHRPVLLNLRASATALISAAFVWPPKDTRIERQAQNITYDDHDDDDEDDEDNEDHSTASVGGRSRRRQSFNGDLMSLVEPLFVPPDWVVLIVEVIFWSTYVGFPIIFTLYRGGSYQFPTYFEGLLVSVFIVALITCPVYAGMHLLVYCWPRAARIDAFLRGKSTAEFLWYPYFTDLRSLPVIGPPLDVGGEAERMERDPTLAFSRAAREEQSSTKSNSSKNSKSNNTTNIDVEAATNNGLVDADPEDESDEVALYMLRREDETEEEHMMRRRSLLRLGVAGGTYRHGKRDVVYRSLDAWDTNRVDPMYVHPEHLHHENESHELTPPKLSKSMIREMMLITTAASVDTTLSPWNSLGALGSPGHLLWHKCFRYRCFLLWRKLGCLSYMRSLCCEKIDSTGSKFNEKKCYCFDKDCSNNWALLIIFVLYGLVIGLSFVPSFAPFAQTFMALISMVCGFWLWQMIPAIIGRSFYGILLFQIVWQFSMGLGAGLFAPQSQGNTNNQHETVSGGNGGNGGNMETTSSFFKFTNYANGTAGRNWPNPKHTSLPICHQRWGLNGGFSILDAAFLANSIYEPDGGIRSAKDVFQGGPLSDWNRTSFVRQFQKFNDNDLTEEPSMIQWSRWDFNTINTTVFVVRGTSNLIDALQDMSYYSIASSLKVVLNAFLPIQHVMPVQFIQTLIEFCMNNAFAPVEYTTLLKEVINVRDGLRRKNTVAGGPGGQTMIVGHSLGGAYAQIVGGVGKVQTMTLSPPGLFYGLKKFGLNNITETYPYLSALIPDNDLVPLADFQKGNIQNIPCTAELNKMGDHILCHSAKRTLAMLLYACPDVTHPGREWKMSYESVHYSYEMKHHSFNSRMVGSYNEEKMKASCSEKTRLVVNGDGKKGSKCEYFSKDAEENVPNQNVFRVPDGWDVF